MKHDIHRRDELKFIERYAAYASQSGLENVVCLCANYEKADQLEELAQSSHVAEIATDPYWPYVFKKIAPLDRKAHVAYWADYTREVAEANDKRHHVWVQNFGIPAGQESIIAEHVEIVQRHAGSIALWGFHGCEAVPGFQKVGQLKPREAWALSRSAIARQAIV